MKSFKNYINEIYKLRQTDFTGGKNYISGAPRNAKWKPLPGGSGLQWVTGVKNNNFMVYIGDKGETVGELCLKVNAEFSDVLDSPMEVQYITVDEDYQGRGIAKSLYGIVLSILKITLVAGESQTPGGRRNWLSLVKIPGLEVKGLIKIHDSEFGPDEKSKGRRERWQVAAARLETEQADSYIDQIMKLGGEYLGKTSYDFRLFAFDVQEGNGELTPKIKTALSKIYNPSSGIRADITLFAQWKGK